MTRCLLSFVTSLSVSAGADIDSGEPPALEPAAAPAEPTAAPAATADVGDFAELSLDDLLQVEVTTASKHEETLAEAPATVTVLTHEDFFRNGWLTVADALAGVPGIYVSYGRDYHHVGVRGVSLPRDVNTRLLVLQDGHAMNNPYSAEGFVDELATLPVEAIERIEVIRGPSSSVYGSNAFLAVVNIVSRPATAAGEATRSGVSLGWSSLRAQRAAAVWKSRPATKDVEIDVHALVLNGDGPELTIPDMTRPGQNAPAPTVSGGTTKDTDFERGYNLGATGRYLGATATLQWADRLKGLPLAPNGSVFDDPYNSLADRHGFAELRYERALAGHAMMARAYWDRFEHHQFLRRSLGDWLPGTWLSDDPHTVSEGNDDTYGAEIQCTLLPHPADTLVVGVEYQRHQVTQQTYELDPATDAPLAASVRGGPLDADGAVKPVRYWNVAAYLQNHWRPQDGLGVVAGVRYDYNSLFSRTDGSAGALETFAPRAAVVYSPVKAASVKLLYGEAFRNPSIIEAFFDDGTSVCGNKSARPERARTLELAGIWGLTSELTAAASLFYTEISSLLQKVPVAECYQDSGPRLQFVNRGKVAVAGGEASIDLRLPAEIRAFANLGAWKVRQASVFSHGALRLANSPSLVVQAGGSVPLWQDRVFASARVGYLSERRNWTSDPKQPEGSVVLVDASLSARKLFAGTTAGLHVANLLDWSFRDPVSSSETIPAAVLQNGLAVSLRVGHEW